MQSSDTISLRRNHIHKVFLVVPALSAQCPTELQIGWRTASPLSCHIRAVEEIMGHKNFTALCSAVMIALSASADPRPAQPLFPERELRNVWRFNSADELDATRTRPLLLYNIHFAESWSGFSLHMAGDQPTLLALPAKTSAGYTNLASESGMIRFWFAP